MNPAPPIEIETGPAPTASIIILHGLGASGDDFAPVAHELDLADVGPVRFVLPHAPMRPVTINGGQVMPAWFDIVALGGKGPEDEPGLRDAMARARALIERECARGVPAGRIVLGGFSQGCAVALMTGLRHPQRLAGIMGLSGFLPLAARTEAERHAANLATPIFMAHGRFDGMIALPRATASRDVLRGLGHPVHWHEYPMDHEVCMQELADLQAWLRKVLAQDAAPKT
jgi:phospholipase/carboxylesterase